MIIFSESSQIAVKSDPDYDVFTSSAVSVVVVEGEVTPQTNKDANLLVSESSEVRTDGQIPYLISDSPSFTSQTPSIATVDSSGYVTRVTNGTAKILVEAGPNRQNVFVPVSYQTGEETVSLSSWATGSLAKFVTDRIASLTAGVVPSPATRSRFSGSCFCLSYLGAMTGVAIEVNGSPWMGFTAITARHVITVAHIGDYSGRKILFGDGTLRTLTHRYVVPGVDIAVYLMDSQVPNTVRVLRLLPSDLSLYLPNPQYGVPLLFLDRNDYVNIGSTGFINSSAFSVSRYNGVNSGFYDFPQEGTSGKPVMITTNLASVSLSIIGLLTYPESGPSLHALDWTSIIPAVDSLAGISTGLQPARNFLGSYPQYP